MNKNRFNKTVYLGLLFIVLVVGGRYIFRIPRNSADMSSTEKTQTQSEAGTKAVSQSSEPTLQAKEDSISACSMALKQETLSKKTEYEKGTVLVTFKAGASYKQAKEILATYGISIQNETSSTESFNARRLITGAFTPGEEFTKICFLRADERIAYAGLNIIFNLHE
ncbi:hypothetical protein KW782_03570 [Candidatus Parcubacteria bacterium]|nr:hypothetical protein [Candidatus Parcubacteria bacterium]